ncbi:hypothetical protein HMPREF9525_03112 [Enterococcus faecium TX0133a04]|nr:hypothetical protein HMPREF9525_03112 [Enterococcus faecium TX0133a04]
MTKVLSQPLIPNKRCSKACICGNKLNPNVKIGKAIFVWPFLLLDAGQLLHNL